MSLRRPQGGSKSLRNRASELESQLVLRRHRLRSLASAIPRKLASRLASPGMLLAAAGAGVAVEQASHQRGWANSVAYQAASILFGMLFARPSQVPQVDESA